MCLEMCKKMKVYPEIFQFSYITKIINSTKFKSKAKWEAKAYRCSSQKFEKVVDKTENVYSKALPFYSVCSLIYNTIKCTN